MTVSYFIKRLIRNIQKKIKIISFVELPDSFAFHLTYRCNCKCKMCFQVQMRKGKDLVDNELTFNQIKKIIDKINGHYPQRKPLFFLTGGEPFVRKDIYRIIEYLIRSNNKVLINSNFGNINLLIFSKKINLIKNPRLNFIVSLDGSEEVHDKIRGAYGLFKKAIKVICFLNKYNKRVHVNYVINKYNYDNLLIFYNKIKDLNISLNFQHLMWMSKDAIDKQKKLNLKYSNLFDSFMFPERKTVGLKKAQVKILKQLIERVKKKALKDNITVTESGSTGQNLDEHYCIFNTNLAGRKCGDYLIRIGPDGGAKICQSGVKFADLLKEDLREIVRKKRTIFRIIDESFSKKELFPFCVKCCKLLTKDLQ